MTPNRRRLLAVPAAALFLAAAGCSGTDAAASITVPSPTEDTVKLCRALDRELPQEVDGAVREDPEPASELTAAWGGGKIVLRCGVPRPAKMTDGRTRGWEFTGVDWLPEELGDGGYRFTTVLREAYVEVSLPPDFAGGTAPLVDLGPAVRRAIPEGIAPSGD